jgi:hypothetical protein
MLMKQQVWITWIPSEGILKDICQNENYCGHIETGQKISERELNILHTHARTCVIANQLKRRLHGRQRSGMGATTHQRNGLGVLNIFHSPLKRVTACRKKQLSSKDMH